MNLKEEASHYQSPLGSRYASPEMSKIFSPQHKYSTWRKLWAALARAEMKLGLPITQQQIDELEAHIEDIDFHVAASYEETLQHDVMAHIYAYGDKCPTAKPIIHLGATSCFVTDNGDLIQIREALQLMRGKLMTLMRQLAAFAETNASMPALGFTHFQAAQLTTVGKRACLWLQDFLIDLLELNFRLINLRFLGVKGTTGTQASYLALFDGDHRKVEELDRVVAEMMGFSHLFTISGQTYTRKQDQLVLNLLATIASSAHKCATDLRLLAHLKEIEEPFGTHQVGSTAMPYKRNPILSERVCSLARYVISLTENPAYTAATQWLERSLDDSANRRLCIADSFLATDAILDTLIKITSGLNVNPMVIARHIQEELPFMATENILMACVKKGGDRQDLHERLRRHSQAAANRVKQEGLNNDLIERIATDAHFGLSREELQTILNVENFTGRAPEQVHEFLNKEVYPLLNL